MEFNVRNYGAVGDGITKDTAAIQAAVDAAAATGGKVILPPGRYLTGGIILRDNICFEMMHGAELFASVDRADYPDTVGSCNSRYRKKDGSDLTQQHLALLYSYNAKNITIRGGHLLTDYMCFFEKREQVHNPEHYEPSMEAEAWFYHKPINPRITMLLFEDCQNITVEGMTISDYPCYAGWILGCDKVRFRDMNVEANYSTINADGFHFSSCRNVMITSSRFVCGDDCVAIDGNHNGISQDFIVSDCIFDTSVHAFRIYNGLDPVMNETNVPCIVQGIAISNCTVTNAAGIFDINGHNGDISNITISNITANLEREGTPIVISTLNGTVRNIHISGLVVNGNGTCLIWAEKTGQISGVRLYDSDFVVTPKTKKYAQPALVSQFFPNHCHFRQNHFYFERAKDVIVRGVTLKWTAPVYSDTWTAKRLEMFKKRFPDADITLMEPRHLDPFELVDCEEIQFISNDIPAWEA